MIGPLTSRPEDVAAALEEDPVGFAARAAEVLEGADPLTVLGWAGRAFGSSLAVSAAMGDTVLVHLASRAVPGVDVLFVDTGYHFPETLGTADAVAATYPVRLRVVGPAETRDRFEALRGPLHRADPSLCCALRKVSCLDQVLGGYRAWATGLRRDDAPTRANTPTVAWDARRGLLRIAPIATWTGEDVEAYAASHPDLITNPLVQLGYRSVGCAPCTRPVGPEEHARAGRWAGTAKTECGLHL